MTKKSLHEIGMKHGTDKATFHGFLEFYEQYLPKKVNRLLEIGVYEGASLKMWKEFYPDAEIVGIDIMEPRTDLGEGIKCIQMDATDIFALENLGMFDVIIDDGSHMTKDQQITLSSLFNNNLRNGGIYIMEDLHTSYSKDFVNSQRTTVEILEAMGGWSFFERGENHESVTALIAK